jgi:hypothetical protein
MAEPGSPRLQDQITWTFAVTLGGQAARYGTFAGSFYKQYTPGGVVVPDVHPPRRIEEKIYRFAQGIANTTP